MIDLNIIEKGSSYNKLKKSFIIFICDYDEFGLEGISTHSQGHAEKSLDWSLGMIPKLLFSTLME